MPIEERIEAVTEEAMECRDLRHAWPRRSHPRFNELCQLTMEFRNGRASAATREMECTGGCNVRKTQRFIVTLDGLFIPDGKAKMQYPKAGYLLKPLDSSQAADRVTADELRTAILQRLYPDIKW